MTRPPLIGLTLDREEEGDYAPEPYYVIRANYVEAITRAGGVPVCIPHSPGTVQLYLDAIDGLVVTGGMFDIPASYYGGAESVPNTKSSRTDFEAALLRGALRADMPILGICGGMQLLGVLAGGTLHADIRQAIPSALTHMQPHPHDIPFHEVRVSAGTKLRQVLQTTAIRVNSVHHQSLSTVGASTLISAQSPDGIIEAIELSSARFAIGVQWHPEYHLAGEAALFNALVEESRERLAASAPVETLC